MTLGGQSSETLPNDGLNSLIPRAARNKNAPNHQLQQKNLISNANGGGMGMVISGGSKLPTPGSVTAGFPSSVDKEQNTLFQLND